MPAVPNVPIDDPSFSGLPRSGSAPVVAPPRHATLAVLRVHNYRLFITSQVVANTGVWMQRITQDWLVLRLTGSVTAVGVNAALQFAPVVVFGLFGGVLADRYPKRMLLVVTQSVAGVLAAALAVLTLSGGVRVEHVFAVSFALGVVTAVDSPVRQVFVPELVGRAHLRSALSLNSSVFQLGGVVGPAVGGVLIDGFSEGWAFAINAVACAFVVLMLCRVRGDLLHQVPVVPRARGQLLEGLRYVRDTPAIFWAITLAAVVGLLTQNMPVVLSAFAGVVFDTGAGGFGTYTALLAVGGVLGALLATQQRTARLRSLVTLAVLLGIALAAAAVAPGPVLFAVALLAAGATSLLFLIGANLLIQLGVDVALGGRVLALYVMALLGGRALGGPAIGWASEELGARLALLSFGCVMVLAAIGIGLILARTGSLRLSVRFRNRERRAVIAIAPRVVERQSVPDQAHP